MKTKPLLTLCYDCHKDMLNRKHLYRVKKVRVCTDCYLKQTYKRDVEEVEHPMKFHATNKPNTTNKITIILFALQVLYLMPYFIAHEKEHKHKALLGSINMLLGWTIIAWVLLFVWSFYPGNKVITSTPSISIYDGIKKKENKK